MRKRLLVISILVLLGSSVGLAQPVAPVKMDFPGEMELIFYRNSGGLMVAVDSIKASAILFSIEASGANGVVACNCNWSGKTAQAQTFSAKMNGPLKTAIDETKGELTGMGVSGE